ncbi:hypothetical protein [Actinoplanes derwentensis]|uniref:Deoxyxylulose-5-phosphate synthase n=1 Tax=Actinoplanes derwentensis TaxID=113562 RepID=A0A1H1T0E6_9ACTN|nr:hypothetical protein [Actinoplanes derwentensis]GID90466.1 hypothetical protein Ade03nite_93900 [Actinoplanes derwentensis]SDS53737.1 hypothetical protein SAMN04489716_1003 [Actinoplanes derwentensis]
MCDSKTIYRVHYVCVPCRRSSKLPGDGLDHPCPQCRVPMVNAGHDFAAPRRRDLSGWRAVAAVVGAGLRYEGFEACGCGREPQFRPRTSAQVRQRRRLAVRRDVPLVEALAARDPYETGGSGVS